MQAVPRRRALRLGGQQRIRLLIALLVLADLALLVLGPAGGTGPAVHAGWLLAGAFALAEVFVFHLQLRRNAYSFTFSEVALVVGLVEVPLWQLVVCLVVGVGLSLSLHRRQSVHKLAFNLSQFTLTTLLAGCVFSAVAPAPGGLGRGCGSPPSSPCSSPPSAVPC